MKIEINHFSKKFRTGQLFLNQSLDLDLDNHLITFIIGENGSGKTTLMKIISGILYVNEGHFEKINDVNYTKWCRESCYYVPASERGLTFKLTGKENIIALCSLKGSSKKEILRKLQIYAPLFQAESILDKKIEELSTGQKRKIHILSAFCSPSKVLLLDEPTIGLDENNLELLINNLKYFNKTTNKKIIIVSHEKFFQKKLLNETITIDTTGKILTRRGIHI